MSVFGHFYFIAAYDCPLLQEATEVGQGRSRGRLFGLCPAAKHITLMDAAHKYFPTHAHTGHTHTHTFELSVVRVEQAEIKIN